jgi:staphylococcal nuclease domain-containing protein 1
MVLIAGIRAPSTKRTNPSDGQEQAAEPFGEEAQQFVESRMLQRNVQVVVLGLSPQNQIVATVKHPTQGTIAPHILKAGLAKCTDFHTTLLGQEMGVLRQAELEAKKSKVGVYRGHVAAQKAGSEAEAVVSRILSADTIFLRNNKTGNERRVNLSSVRQPKPSDPKQGPWQAEAKEFLRKKIIGKHVKFHIDGKRAATEGYEEREMGTVTANGKNVGALLVENGFASVIRHRADDTDRSPIYDELLLAEQTAQQEKKGMWADKPPATKGYVDYSESLEKAKRQMAMLSRQKKVPAVVDYVKSASRFTVLVPGALYINRENFAKLLLEEGYASVHAYSAEKSGSAAELFAAEKKAKDARKGLWHDYDPSQDEEDEDATHGASNGNGYAAAANGDSQAKPKEKDYRDVCITHVDESGRLKVQQIGKGTAALEDLMSSFRKFHLSGKPLDQAPKAGDYVSAKFEGDWYRGRVRRNDREKKKAEVVYVDFGNVEMVDWSALRPLAQDKFGPSVLKPQAVDATLSFVQLPNGQYLNDTIQYLKEEVLERVLVVSVDFVDKDGTLSVTLFDQKRLGEDPENSVNADLVSEGLAMVPRKLKAWEKGVALLGALKKKEAVAIDEHRGMWEYGDATADDD